METGEEVLRLGKLSDQELLAGLSGVLGSGRKVLALLVAHLGEVEERRLHLLEGYGSMFVYCTNRLGMSEDEACRRIEVARLARRFPVLLERLATGRISLSVAALLKMHLSEVNHVALLDAVAGKTVKIAREVLAAWFPRPDVLASIRKLPERQASGGDAGANAGVLFDAPSLAGGGNHSVQKEASASESAFESTSADCTAAPGARGQRAAVIGPPASRSEALAASRARDAGRVQPGLGDARGGARAGSAPLDEAAGGFGMRRDTNIAPRCAGPAVRIGAHVVASGSRFAEEPTANSPAPAEHPAPLTGMRAPKRASLELEPLSPGRYKIVFTADADLKRKLDLARDLLRHAEPHGELAAIIGRGLDLLIERTLQRRFGKTTRRRAHSSAARDGATPHVATATAVPTAEYVDPERVASDDDVPAVSKAAPGAAPAANEPVPSAGAPIIAGIAPTPIPNDDASEVDPIFRTQMEESQGVVCSLWI